MGERYYLFKNKKGFIYLSLITDAYSRKIVGYNLSRNLKAEGCIKAFQMALKSRLYPKRPLIHHSDRGIQYCCDDYVQLLISQNVQISMTQNGSPYDNAIAERVNGILKQEFNLYQSFDSYQKAKDAVENAIISYNQIGPHFSCQLQIPQAKHASSNAR
ncbi:DDE-type integrase/transposase/recombinase [Pseudopedobacter saltans]|uniref:DDE-type integrase/transposase/recombinase n=1 Tax=Pseudopedobacter saltans TaxID=151895 RepID=UPI0001EBC49A|nr:DDE-type integrase/transposase/recombinase [Pseudopedobacter saltans]